MATNSSGNVSAWVGWVYFAAFMLVVLGFFQSFMGLTALLNNQFYVAVNGTLLVFDITTWGWIHLIFGIVAMVAGTALFSGSTWARIVAIILVGVNFVMQFAFVSEYPIWSIIAMIIDLLILYALIIHGREALLDE